MNYKFFVFLIGFILVTVFGISLQIGTNTQPVNKSEISKSPSEVVETFVQTALVRDFNSIKDMIRPYPNQYLECLYETLEECRAVRNKNKSRQNVINEKNLKIGRGTSIGKPVTSLIVEKFAEAIADEKIVFNGIESEWIVDNEARVRIRTSFNSGVQAEDMDFLLLKENEKWKIFELIDKGKETNFALPLK